MKLRKLLHRHTLFIIIAVIIGSYGIVYAINTVSTWYQLGNSSSQTIDAHGTCKKVVNNSGNTYFVPTNTSTEWSNFRSNLPGSVSLQSCIDDSLAYSFATSEYWGAWCGNWTCWNNMANTWTHIYSWCAYSYSWNGVVLTSSSITNNNSFAVILEPDNAERTLV